MKNQNKFCKKLNISKQHSELRKSTIVCTFAVWVLVFKVPDCEISIFALSAGCYILPN